MMTQASLFSGIGGFDLAAQWMGWENVFHCEINPFGQKILKYYWPNAISYTDITKTDFTIHRGAIDVLTGGFPCQPYSLAGKRLGKEDERHLWPQMLRAVREIQPTWVVGENVFGIVNWNGGMVFNEVQADLEAEGYKVQPYVLPACSVDAPHRRDRVWFVAYSDKVRGYDSRHGENRSTESENKSKEEEWKRLWDEFSGDGEEGATSDALRQRRCGWQPKWADAKNVDTRCETLRYTGSFGGWPTEPPLCFTNDGISTKLSGITFSGLRRSSNNALGNAIHPGIAYQVFKAIEQYRA